MDSLVRAASAQEEIALLGEVNLRTTAVTSSDTPAAARPMPTGIYASARIDLAEYRPNYLRYEYSVPEEALAVFSEIYYDKGWTAYVDGEEAPLLPGRLRAAGHAAAGRRTYRRMEVPRPALGGGRGRDGHLLGAHPAGSRRDGGYCWKRRRKRPESGTDEA